MEEDDEFLNHFFTLVSQSSFDKAKEHIDREREAPTISELGSWMTLLNHLMQISLAEKSYMDIGFLQTKNKGFLRKDNSLKSVYDSLRIDIKRLEDISRPSVQDVRITNYCQNLFQFLTARIDLMDFYDKMYLIGTSKQLKFNELLIHVENLIQKNALGFTDISATPIKAVFNMECEILEQLLRALTEMQRLQFLTSLALIHGAHTRLTAWENKMQNRETWKLGFLKNNPLPLLFQWLLRFKGAVLSKFSLYFHDILAQQTAASSEMRQLCSRLQSDYYHKMCSFQKKNDAVAVLLLSDSQVSCDTTDYDCFPIIVAYPPKPLSQLETILKMISDTSSELSNMDKIIYKFSSQEQFTYILSTVEPNIYLIAIFDGKKSEKDTYVTNFFMDLCINLRCSKVFMALKNPVK